MIDTADLPAPVRKAVEQVASAPAEQQAAVLRAEGAKRLNAACSCWNVAEWPTGGLLGLTIGFLTAAQRVEEGP